MPNWYCSREQVKKAARITGTDRDAEIDRLIESVSRGVDSSLRTRWFIPKLQTRLYRWPNNASQGLTLYLDTDLLSIASLLVQAQNVTPITIAATDYFLEPVNYPPYNRIEIDLSSTAAFWAGDTPQRSISVTGAWGYSGNTQAAGTVTSGLASDAAAVTMVASNGFLIEVGDTLLIGSEQLFVQDRAYGILGSIQLNDTLLADNSDVTVTVDTTHGILQGEFIRLNSEEMFVAGVSGNDLTVVRSDNGSLLAAHATDTPIYINRTLTVQRAINGTTAVVHADATAISKYIVERDINELAIAEALNAFYEERAGWGGASGAGGNALGAMQLSHLRSETLDNYRRRRRAAI